MKYAKAIYKRNYTRKYGYGGAMEDESKGNSAYNSGVNAVGIVPGIGTAISGFAKLGDAIGAPIKNKAEEMNEDGTLKNKNNAELGYVAGTLFNPYKSLSRVMTDRSASTGQKWAAALTGGVSETAFRGKYSSDLEKNAQGRIEEENRIASEEEAERARIQKEYDDVQQDLYNKAYYSVNSTTGNSGASIYAKYGGKIPKYSEGNSLDKLASDVVIAEGATHEEGGIKLKNRSGNTVAEIEDNEVIKDNNVYSDRISLPNGNTVAEEASKWAKIKGKSEKKVSSSNYREKNSGMRASEFADMKLDQLFELQEASKSSNNAPKFDVGGTILPDDYKLDPKEDDELDDPDYNFMDDMEHEKYWASNKSSNYTPSNTPSSPETSSTGNRNMNWSKIAQYGVPLIDNIYNASLIKQTPDIPIPTKKVAYYGTAMPMKTTYDVDNNLTEANNQYRQFVRNIDNTTNSSQIGRGNKLAGFSQVLKNQSAIYQNKSNIETQLQNANSQNIQNVANENSRNKQNIDNINLSQTDNYNWAKTNRTQSILDAKSANVANAVEDSTTTIKDYNQSQLDKERMELYGSMYPDASVYSRAMGTPSMDKIVSSKEGYERVEGQLEKSGQKETLAKFRKTYKKPK